MSTLTMEARVVRYAPNALRMHFDEGVRSHDATELHVAAPPDRAGQTIWLYHERPASAGSLWRAEGSTLRFTVKSEDLERLRYLFSGAVWDLSRVS